MSAQEEFILYDLRGWMVSFCTVSISSASSSWSNTWHLRARAGKHSPSGWIFWFQGLLLHRLDLQRVQLLVKHLAPARARGASAALRPRDHAKTLGVPSSLTSTIEDEGELRMHSCRRTLDRRAHKVPSTTDTHTHT